MDVYLAVFDRDSFQVGKKRLGRVDNYISQRYVDVHTPKRRFPNVEEAAMTSASMPMMASAIGMGALEDWMGNPVPYRPYLL